MKNLREILYIDSPFLENHTLIYTGQQPPDVDLCIFFEDFHLAFQTYQRNIDALMVFHSFATGLYILDGFQRKKRFTDYS